MAASEMPRGYDDWKTRGDEDDPWERAPAGWWGPPRAPEQTPLVEDDGAEDIDF